MKKPKKFFRKAAAICLAVCMVFTMLPAAFADEIAWDQLSPEEALMLQAQMEEAERIRKEKEKKRLEELAAQAAAAAAAEQAAAEEAARLAAEEAARLAAEEAARKAAEEQASAPAVEAPAVEEPAVEEPDAEEPDTEESAAEEPAAKEPAAEEPAAEEPAAEEPAVKEPAVDEPDAEEPDAEESAAEESAAEEPAAEEPAVEEPAVEEPAVEEPDAEEPAAEEPDAEESAVEEPAAEEPAVEEPAVEEPAVEEPAVEEPAVEESAVEEPAVMLAAAASVAVVEGEEEENTVAETAEAGASAPVVHAPPTASGNIWKAAGQFFKTVKEAIDAIFTADPAATEAKVELTEDYEGSDGIEVDVDEGKNVVIDLCKKTFKVISGIAAKLTGKGSVTVENGTIASEADAAVVETDVADLDIKNVNLIGSGSASPVLDINGGDVDVTGRTTIDSGKSGNTAIDISGASDVDVDTTGVVLGKVSASGAEVAADLHNGFYNGEISADADAKLAVDGGNYTTNVGKYVDEKTNYAEISNPAGKIYSAGKNIPWSALGSSMFAPTFVNMLKSGGAIALPGNIAVGNSTGKLIFINGRAVLNGQSIFIPGCRYMCSTVSIVDGANSVWYKGSEDGLTFEVSAAVSYVAIDNAKADAVIDGVYAELEADTLEALSAGSHSVRFVLKNGSVVVTSIKVAPDEKIEWTKGSENGLQYEMSGKIKKVLIDHVKVSAETDGKNAVISASILQDLKTGKHTVEFVLENTAHVVTSITVK